ncbi:MAG: TldD/PmbA family protein [Bacteriovoracaceae bacterium]
MKDVLEKVLNLCDSKFLDGFDAILDTGKSLNISSAKGQVDKYIVSSSQVVGVRVIKDQKIGISYSEDFSDESLKTMVNNAMATALASEVDVDQTVIGIVKDLTDNNPKTYQEDNTDLKEKIELALKLESGILSKDARAKSTPYNGYGEGEAHRFYGNSSGLNTYERSKQFSCYTSALMDEGGRQAMFYESSTARKFKEMKVEWVLGECLSKASLLLEAKPLSTGRYDIIFDQDVLKSFLGAYQGVLSGKAAKDGVSRFKDQVGKIVAHPEFSFSDCPQYKDGFNYSMFDSEGLMKRDVTLIEKGILKTFYHNTATAKYFGTTTTAHASRSPKGHLGVALEQVVIHPGKSKEKDLKSGRYLYILGIEGLHAGTNSISGHFSLPAYGLLCEDGKTLEPFKGVTISGNYFDLIKDIAGIGDQVHPDNDHTFFAPVIRFPNISVAGA